VKLELLLKGYFAVQNLPAEEIRPDRRTRNYLLEIRYANIK
jgi:hypothetical protein